MSYLTLTIAGATTMALILIVISYSRGNVPGFLAALYCLLLTVGCVVIFSHSPAALVAVQASVSRQQLKELTGRVCATLIQGQSRPIPVREIVCPAGADVDCMATLNAPADQMGALLVTGKSLSVSALLACQ